MIFCAWYGLIRKKVGRCSVVCEPPDTEFSVKTKRVEFEKHEAVTYLSMMTLNYVASRRLNSTQSSLTITVIFCWIEVWFKNDPLGHPEDRNLILSSPAQNHSRPYCFCDSRRTRASTACNFPPPFSFPCICSVSFVHLCSFQKRVNGTCNCTFGGYHNKSALIVHARPWRAMQLGTLKAKFLC